MKLRPAQSAVAEVTGTVLCIVTVNIKTCSSNCHAYTMHMKHATVRKNRYLNRHGFYQAILLQHVNFSLTTLEHVTET